MKYNYWIHFNNLLFKDTVSPRNTFKVSEKDYKNVLQGIEYQTKTYINEKNENVIIAILDCYNHHGPEIEIYKHIVSKFYKYKRHQKELYKNIFMDYSNLCTKKD